MYIVDERACGRNVVLYTVQTSSSWTSRPITSTWRLLKHLAEPCRSSRWISCTLNLCQSWCGVWTADSSDPSAPVNSCIFVAVLYFPIFRLCPVFLFIIVLSCALFFITRYLHQLVSVDCSWVCGMLWNTWLTYITVRNVLLGKQWSQRVAFLSDKCQHRYF